MKLGRLRKPASPGLVPGYHAKKNEEFPWFNPTELR